MNRIYSLIFLAATASAYRTASASQLGHPELLCHRTANKDVPENTMESLEQATLLGCDLVEIDIRRTLDGVLVLNHDGLLERLTDGIGNVETTYYDDLRARDAGSWMGPRFAGLHIARFDDALRYARDQNIRLYLDIKTKGIGPEVVREVERQGMLNKVQFGGEWEDVQKILPSANAANESTSWVQPGTSFGEIEKLHHDGRRVIVNFSANGREMDLASMKAAVTAGADGINVDYPRLGADAVGRPIEQRLSELAQQASQGNSAERCHAILSLSHYRGFNLEAEFKRWLLDPDKDISRAAAVALTTARPQTQPAAFLEAVHSPLPHVRANAAWALGSLGAEAAFVLPLLQDQNAQVLQESLMALGHMPGDIPVTALLSKLSHSDTLVRGAAAVALAKHHPEIAMTAIAAQLKGEREDAHRLYESYIQRGKPKLTQSEIDTITAYFRSEMKMLQAIDELHEGQLTRTLEVEAFHPGEDFSQMSGLVSSFKLWDRIGADPEAAVEALGSSDNGVADRAEWMLVQAGPSVLPKVRQALHSQTSSLCNRAVRIVAWQGDVESLDILRDLPLHNPACSQLAGWAIEKIQSLHPAF